MKNKIIAQLLIFGVRVTVRWVGFVLHQADPGSIPGTSYGP